MLNCTRVGTGDHKRTRTAARILWGRVRHTAAAADAQAVCARVRTVRAGGGVTKKARVTLVSARELPLGEDAVRGENYIVVVLSYWQTPGPSMLD